MTNQTSTKQQLLIILKKEDNSSMKDIMVHFDMSEIAIRRHLRELIRQDLVSGCSVKQAIGRPYHVYRLTKKGHETFPNQYRDLPLELLKDLEEIHGIDVVTDLLNKRTEREQAFYKIEIETNDFKERIKKIIDLKIEKGYMIEYEETGAGNYEIKNYNCPILNIAASYRQVCSNKREVLEGVFPDSEVITHSTIATGDTCCKWTISKPNK